MTPVFLDTVGLIALWDEADQWHSSASKAFEELVRVRRPVVCSTFVLLECGNAAARSPFRNQVVELRENLKLVQGLISPSESDLDAAWLAYAAGHATMPGIVDHVSFEVMHRLGIREAFTNDRHFKAFGFDTLF